jgi:fluoroquinolone resistance protein
MRQQCLRGASACSLAARRVPLQGMFVPRSCAHTGCGRPALSASDFCIVHHPDPEGHVRALLRSFGSPASLRDLDLPGIIVSDADLSAAEISGCRFTAATFLRVKFTGAQITLSFLDRATFTECDFSGASIQNSVVAGSSVTGCSFMNCEIVQVNFLGIRCVHTGFDHSDLYGSRFVGSLMEVVSMKDCNLTRTTFDESHRTAVDFHSSNTNEATFVEPAP